MVASKEEKYNKSTASEAATAKTLANNTLVESSTTLKNYYLDLNSFIIVTQEDLSNTIH